MAFSGTVLSLCDLTGNMVKPWAAAGFSCWCVDLQHKPGEEQIKVGSGEIVKVGADVTTWKPEALGYAAVFAFPPCTDLAISGARWFKDKGLGALIQALSVVEACRAICDVVKAPWMLENPVSTISTYWRKPDFTFDPCDYGGYGAPQDAYTKKTCLWTGGGFCMPAKRPINPIQGSKMHLLPPSKNRANLRSETPSGFAQAVFEANTPWRS